MKSHFEIELKLIPSNALGNKLRAILNGPKDTISQSMKDLLLPGHFTLGNPVSKVIVDTYFDTADHLIRKAQSVLRIRQSGEMRELTIKKIIGLSDGKFDMVESNLPLDGKKYDELKNDNFHKIIKEHFPDVLRGELTEMLTIRNKRFEMIMSKAGEPNSLVFDQFYCEAANQRSDSFFEIEIEAMNEDAVKWLASLREYFVINFPGDIQSSTISKYERCLKSLYG